MKIVNVYNGDFINSSQGGGMRYLRDLMRAQFNRGFQIELLAVGEGAPRDIVIEGVPVRYVPISKTLNWPRFLLGLFLYLLRHGRNYSGATVHLHRVYFSPPFRLLVRKAHIVVTIHTKTFSVFTGRVPGAAILMPVFLFLERVLLKTCIDKISAAGMYAVELYANRHKLDKQEIVLLGGPSHMVASEQPDPALLGDPRKNILCVGRIAAVKRPLSVLRLFHGAINKNRELIKHYRLIFVGEGEDRLELEKAITEYGLQEHVKILGAVNADRMSGIYAAGCCLILLSSSETGPFTVKEALASGLPVFATEVGNIIEYVSENCGVTIPVDYPELQVGTFLAFLDTEFKVIDCQCQANKIRQREETIFGEGLATIYIFGDSILC